MSLWTRLQEGDTNISFVPRWRLWFGLSGAVIVFGLVALFSWGLNLGIEFEGGYSWEAPAGDTSVSDMQEALGGLDATVQAVGTGSEQRIRVKAELNEDTTPGEITTEIAEELGIDRSEVTSQTVSESWGNEITKKAVQDAIKQPRDLDRHLYDAQQARRVLDRLMGYKLSPLLWNKVRRGLSAGRVQSVAVRIICERERAILRSRFGLQGVEEESRRGVAESLGVSVERVRQLEQRALGKLAAAAGGDGIGPASGIRSGS